MRSRTLWSTGLLCLALASACEELNVNDDKEHDTADDSGGDSSGGSSSGGSSSGGSGDADREHGDGEDEDGDPHAKPPRVSIERCGAVVGAWGDHGVRKFLGIPYAKEPSGELRWAAPQRPDKWDDDREATKFARACPGVGGAPAKGDKHPEDCLYLNVWAPEKPKKPLPVMVWFHGGDHLRGSAAEAHSGDDAARFDGSGSWKTPPLPWHAETPEAILASDQLRQCLEKVLAALPLLQREVITLRDVEGLDMAEICNILEVKETHARVLLHRARARARSAASRIRCWCSWSSEPPSAASSESSA